jgi:hypothetical protein
VTGGLRRRLHDFGSRNAQALVGHPAQALLSQSWPRIWISVRQVFRTAVNFDDFFLEFVKHTFERYPKAAIFLDGFSLRMLLEECCAEYDRRMHAFDAQLLKPVFLPRLAGFVLAGLRLGRVGRGRR